MEGEETLQFIRQAGTEGRFMGCDVSKPTEVEELVRQIEETYGRLDFAFNNAGVAPKNAPLAEQEEAEFDRMVAINLKGLRAGGGAIVNNASMGGLVAYQQDTEVFAAARNDPQGTQPFV